MNTRNLMRKLPSCLLGAIFVVGVASTTVNAVDGVPPGLFELDGNTLDDIPGIPFGNPGTPGDDWSSVFANTDSAIVSTLDKRTGSPTINTPIVSDPAPLSIFTQGGSKDVNDVSAWKHTDGAVPDKDDITDAYAVGYNMPADIGPHKKGDLIVYFGLDRLANNGDANAAFWFFQNEVIQDAGGTFVDGDGDPATHVAKTATKPGDLLIVVKYPQGSGAVPLIKVYEWDPNDADGDSNADPDEKGGKFSPLDLLIKEADGECTGSGGKLACAITNHDTLANEPDWPYAPKSGSASDLPLESFYEGGINVSRLLGTTPCFASFLAETRSSESQTAQLKDFVLSGFPVCDAKVTKECAATFNQATNNVTVNFTGTATNTGAQSEFITLKDSQAGSKFTAVCIDTTGVIGKCDGTDAAPTGLAGLNTDTASFTLLAGQQVRYEGNYTAAPASSFSDTVTLSFSSGAGQPVLGTRSATANCPLALKPDLTIAKICDPDIGGGSGVRLVVDGGKVVVEVGNKITVQNTGQEALKNVTISDTEVQKLQDPDGAGTVWACTDATLLADAKCEGKLAFNETVVLKQTYKPDGGNISGSLGQPNTVFFKNTASAQGTGDISGFSVGPKTATATCELCPPDPVP